MEFLQNISLVQLGVFMFLYFPISISGLICSHITDVNHVSGDWGTLLEGIYLYPTRNSTSKDQLTSTGETEEGGCPYTAKDASMALDTIDKIVNTFWANNIDKFGINRDDGHGLKVLRSQLVFLLEEKQAWRLSPTLKSFLVQLQEASGIHAKRVLDEALRQEMDPNVRKFISMAGRDPVIMTATRTWHKVDAITKHFGEFKNIGNEKEVVDVDLSHKCLAHLLSDCSFPQLCQITQRREIYSQYMLTRQAFLQNAAQKRSCEITNPDAFKYSDEYADRLCSKIYLEVEFLAKHQFPTRFVDLFAEHVGICGLMGYPNFMRADWLREILSWREGSATGCMANLYGTRKLTDVAIKVKAVGRKDGKSEEDCLLHLTSVSLMALSMHLRYMVDVCGSSLFDEYFSSRV